jgi:1,4-alpha-glucan branching enzyme
MGCEFGQESEWSEARSLDWWLLDLPDHRGVFQLIRDLNATYRGHPALWTMDAEPAGFQWIDANDEAGNVLSFLRWAEDGSCVAVICNFAGVPHEGYRIGLPAAGEWREILNTDAELYSGSGVGNLGAVTADVEPCHGQPASATLTLPPLGVLYLASPTVSEESVRKVAPRSS